MGASTVQIAREAAELLSVSGLAELHYLTAEFEPFSSQQRPDLSFVPNSGHNAGSVFFVELRLTEGGGRPQLPPAAALAEHRDFVRADIDSYLHFGVAITGHVAEELFADLAIREIRVLNAVDSGRALARAMELWADAAERPPWSVG